MNWRRGLWRLWIVFTIAWVVSMFWLMLPEVQDVIRTPSPQTARVTLPDCATRAGIPCDCSRKGSDCFDFRGLPKLAPPGRPDVARPGGEWVDEPVPTKGSGVLWRAAFLGFIVVGPPLLLLVLGAAGLWIARGFQDSGTVG